MTADQPRDLLGKRLLFIDLHLFWVGEVRRKDLKSVFGIEDSQAKSDLRNYRQILEEHNRPHLIRRASDSVNIAPENFRPVLAEYPPQAEQWLERLNGRAPVWSIAAKTSQPLEADPLIDSPPELERHTPIDPFCFRALLRATRERRPIELVYATPHSSTPVELSFAPHAFCTDTFRWACRGWRDDYGRWGEVVLDRIEDVKEPDPETRERLARLLDPPVPDTEWQEVFTVRLGPNPGLPADSAAAIKKQYGMVDHELRVPVRRALLVYFLKRYQLEEPVTHKAPHQAPLVVLNRDEVRHALPPRMRVPPEPELVGNTDVNL